MSYSGPRGRGRGWHGRGTQGSWWRGRGNNRGSTGQLSNPGVANDRAKYSNATVSRSSEGKRHGKQTTLFDQVTPFVAWTLYFPNQLYSEQSPMVVRVKSFQKFFTKWRHLYATNVVSTNGYFTVDFKELSADSDVLSSVPDLASEMRQTPELIINGLELALHQLLVDEMTQDKMVSVVGLGKLHCRVVNFEPTTHLKSLRANYYGKFISLKGTVVRVSYIKPLCIKMAYECASCCDIQAVSWPDGKCVVPTTCPGEDCRSRTFIPCRKHLMTETVDFQTIRLQEMFSDDLHEAGRIPRTIDCELTCDLVDSCVPGDMVTVSGIVKVTNAEEGSRMSRQKDKCVFLMYLHVNSLANSKGHMISDSAGAVMQSGGGVSMEFSVKELYAIEQIQSEKNLFQLITGSLCPAIYGHELVKAGLVLGLFGGSHRFVDDKNRIPVRGDPHILVVGDPGLGKSQMLQSLSGVAPRSVYVCGNTTTTSGLTVTLCKDSSGGDYALEAGALVLADQGCCCIDEFDKMGHQHQALLEAMEQQSISIAKAGIVCSLPARTSIIAAANPVGGHYNKAKTIAENLRMGSALLSRFDLVFILLDKPDEDMDSLLSEHVMALHAGKHRLPGALTAAKRHSMMETQNVSGIQKPLSERLKVTHLEAFDPIPPQLLRKYIGYARKYVHPKVSSAAASVLQEFYLDLRKNHQTKDSTPITTRQLESLIRLTEARARLELREEASEEDALDVIEIMKYSMIDAYCDDLGMLDFKRSQNGSGMSSRSQAKKFIAVLQSLSAKTSNSLFMAQELRQIAKEAAIEVRDFEVFLASLNDQGYLLKKGPRVYQLQVTDY